MRTYIPDGYEITKNRYLELYAMCLQYGELKHKLNDCYSLSAMVLSDMPRVGSKTSVVERAGERAMRLRQTVELIEETAKTACEDEMGMYPALMKNITQGYAWERIPDCPCGRRHFYDLRRKFFYMLDEAKT